MRRLSFVIGSVLLLAGGLSSLFAQRGGGHSSGGHVSGGHVSGGHANSGTSSTTFSTLSNRSPAASQLIFPTPIGLQRQYSGYTGINPGVLPTGNRGYRGYGNRGYGYGYGIPFYLSTFDDYDSYGYDGPWQSYGAQDPAAQTGAVTANLLGEQISQLSAEVDALRNEQAGNAPGYPQNYRPNYGPPYQAPPVMQEDETPTTAPVTLVLRSGKQMQLKSYAVMDQYIWDFGTQPARKIALATVDLNASRSATEAAGGEFPELR